MKKILFGLMLFCASSVSIAQIPSDAQAKVNHLLKQHYGTKYNTKQKCYEYAFTAYEEDGAEKELYCVNIVDSKLKTLNGVPTLYLATSGDTIEDASRVTTGLGGFFILQKHEQQWQIIAKNPYLASGGGGMSRISDYQLVRIAPNQYGWIGEEGATGAGGESSSSWYMYAPVGSKIKQIADIEIAHSYDFISDNRYINDSGTVSILHTQATVNGYYPLQVNLTLERGRLNKNFDPISKKISKVQYYMSYNPKTLKFEKRK